MIQNACKCRVLVVVEPNVRCHQLIMIPQRLLLVEGST